MNNRFRPFVYAEPMSRLTVGESFIMNDLGDIESCRVSAYKYGRKHDMKFSVRRTDEGVRCQRIA